MDRWVHPVYDPLATIDSTSVCCAQPRPCLAVYDTPMNSRWLSSISYAVQTWKIFMFCTV
jgi:hypothetical protein